MNFQIDYSDINKLIFLNYNFLFDYHYYCYILFYTLSKYIFNYLFNLMFAYKKAVFYKFEVHFRLKIMIFLEYIMG